MIWDPQAFGGSKTCKHKITKYLGPLGRAIRRPSGRVVAFCAYTPQIRGSILGRGKVNSAFHPYCMVQEERERGPTYPRSMYAEDHDHQGCLKTL
ncbi:hypothetical protein TNCV_549631 [Trichonephila clavipes]|nr:hypothetical protein TNCV_549631 [Trichonephila clavipes]